MMIRPVEETVIRREEIKKDRINSLAAIPVSAELFKLSTVKTHYGSGTEKSKKVSS